MSDFDNAVVAGMLKAKEIGVKMLASDCEAILQSAIASMQGDDTLVAEIKSRAGDYHYIHWHTLLQQLPVGTKLFTYPPSASAEIARLTAELKEARKDAERYRYIKRAILRQPGGPYAFATYMGWIGSTFERGFDEAIDAALSKIGGGE